VPTRVISLFLEKLAALIWEGKTPRPKVDRDFFETYKDAFRQAIEDGWKEAGIAVDWSSPDMLRLAVMEANVFRFACAKSDALVRTLSELARKSDTFKQFKDAADQIGAMYNKRYLETEFNFAHAVGQNGAKYQRRLKEKHIFPYWRYRTVGDHRVRYAHQILDGKIFEVGSEAEDIVAPPNGWGCRCEDEQISGDALGIDKPLNPEQVKSMLKSVKNGKSTEWDYMVKNGFNINRGKLGEVFREQEFYTDIKKTPGAKVVKETTEVKVPETFLKTYGKDLKPEDLPNDFWKVVPENQVYNRTQSVKTRGGGDAFYLPSTKEIVIKKGNRWKGSEYYRKHVVVHESAHAIHYDKNLITKTTIDSTLESRMKNDLWNSLVKDMDVEAIRKKFQVREHWNNVRELADLDKFSKLKKEDISSMLTALADTIEALSVKNGRYLAYGHGIRYQSMNTNAYKEIFAHVFENKFVGNAVFEHFFPTLFSESLTLADEILTTINK